MSLLFAQFGPTTIVIPLALVVLTGWMLMRTYRRLARQRKMENRPLWPKRSDLGHHVEGPPEEAAWEVRMYELARDLSAQSDSKMRALQALIADADRAAARLEAASANKPQSPPTKVPTSQQSEEIHTLADYGFPSAEIANRLGVPVGEVQRILGLRS